MADDLHDDVPDDTDRPLVRSPTYLLRLCVGVLVLLAGVLLAWRFDNTGAALNLDTASTLRWIPSWIRAMPEVLVIAVMLLTPLVVNLLLLRYRRWRLFGLVNLAAIAAAGLGILLVDRTTSTPPSRFPDAYVTAGQVVQPHDALLAAFVGALVVGWPYLPRTVRRLGVAVVVLHGFVSLSFGGVPEVGWLIDLGAGLTCGAAVALAFGTPDTRPRAEDLIDALARSGFALAEVHPAAVDARGSTPWFGTTHDGRSIFIKVLNQDNRSADLMFRAVRLLLLRNTGDERPMSSLRRSVEHEALLSLRATSVGIPTPQLRAVSSIGPDGMLLAFETIEGDSLDRVPPEGITDEVLDEVWRLLVDLRGNGIAHRDLRLANVFLDDGGRALIIDFGFAELAASDLLLDTDLAELIGSTSTAIGVERAVAAAERAVGAEGLAAALPRLHPFALGSATRTALRENDLFEPLRAEVRRRADVPEVVYEELAPVRPERVAAVLAAGVAVWVAIPLLVGGRGTPLDVVTAAPGPALLVLACSAVTYLGATLAQIGALRDALQFRPTLLSRLASSFANRITAARSGGVALGVRFLQKQGVDTEVALSSVGLVTMAGFSVHVAALYVAGKVALDRGDLDVGVSSGEVVLVGLTVAVLLTGLVMLLPRWRHRVLRTLLPAVRRAGSGLMQVLSRPTRLVQLFVGSVLVTAFYIAALTNSVRALGGNVDVPSIAVVFLLGTLLAAPAPTPGGLGAVEAVLIAGLVVVGETMAVAVPAVFLYRLLTYWLPMLPGWFAYRDLERAGRI